MHRLFQRFARSIGLAHDPNIPSGSAERPLRALLVASIVLPILLFAIVAAISYRQHFMGARATGSSAISAASLNTHSRCSKRLS